MLAIIKRLSPWLATFLCSIVLILFTRDRQSIPIQGKVNDLIAIGSYPVSSSVKMLAIWSESRRLRRELVARVFDQSQADEVAKENQRLRQMLDFKQRTTWSLLATEVIGFTSDEGVKGLLINSGSDEGILTGQAVIVPDGLVGRVYRVYDNSAAVQFLGDPNLGIAARLVNGQESGIVHSTGSGRLKLDGVPVSAATGVGDSVVTSGQGGVFPPGILIGFTTRVSPSAEGWLLQVELRQSVDTRRLDEVFVVRLAPTYE